MYHVYEAASLTSGERFVFCCSSIRLVSLKRQIANGELAMTLGALVLTTNSRNEARTYGSEM